AWVMTTDLQRALTPSANGVKEPDAPGHYGAYEFHLVAQRLQTFCSEDLGGFYLDILKDRLYTAPESSRSRRSAQNALYHITHGLTRLLAPILSFTAEEVWQVLGGGESSIFEHTWYEQALPADAEVLRQRWERLRTLRSDVLKQLETLRVAGKIGSSLAGEVDLHADGEAAAFLRSFDDDLRFVFITSQARVADDAVGDAVDTALPGVKVSVTPSPHAKCERCWHYRADVGADTAHLNICGRCVSNLFGSGEPRTHA
ncbi:MAG TPA: class I tRNA ligase family protein, partial [Burkholderiales bacterium]|nr:class I tRNA ligase family protein [Burkholderiales bacterium]